MSEQPAEQVQPDYPAPSPAPPAPSPAAEPVAEPVAPAEPAVPVAEPQPMPVTEPEADPVVTQPVPPAEEAGAADLVGVNQLEEPVQPVVGTSNVTSTLPPGSQAAAARMHAMFTHLKKVAEAGISEVEKYVPQPVLEAAATEIKALLREII